MLELRGNPCVTTFQRLLCSLCFSAWLSAPGLVFAQGNGEVHLEVKDPSGAATEATGRLENLKTGADQIIPTDGQGHLEFKGLAPGRYRVHVSKAGFASQSIFVDLQSNTSVSYPLPHSKSM
jgi:hypothetical protein